MFDEFDDLDLATADQRIRERLDELRAQMSALGQYRADRIRAAADEHGRGGAVIVARDLGITPVAVYRILDTARARDRH